jgi:pimeloyl-ACP methyl ester carboxylesterase
MQNADPSNSGYIKTAGISYYYEIHGQGDPLLLLHGGLGSTDMLQPLLPNLVNGHQIIAIDLLGHGRTMLGDRPISLEAMAADVAAILDELGFDAVDVLGYSMGAGVALQLAAQHPEKLRRLVLVSARFAQNGFHPEIIGMHAQMGGHMEVSKLAMPVMLIFGDSDMFRLAHIVEFYQLLGGGLRDAGWKREYMSQNRLAILPGATHYDIFLDPRLTETALSFLSGKVHTANWGD